MRQQDQKDLSTGDRGLHVFFFFFSGGRRDDDEIASPCITLYTPRKVTRSTDVSQPVVVTYLIIIKVASIR